MTLAELKTILTGITGLSNKVAYRAFPVGDAPELPFVCYYETSSDSFAADGITYFGTRKVNVELYSEPRDLTTEGLIEAAFSANGIYFDREVEYIDSERCFETIYSIEV